MQSEGAPMMLQAAKLPADMFPRNPGRTAPKKLEHGWNGSSHGETKCARDTSNGVLQALAENLPRLFVVRAQLDATPIANPSKTEWVLKTIQLS